MGRLDQTNPEQVAGINSVTRSALHSMIQLYVLKKMKEKKKSKVYADLMDSPERITACIEIRRKRRKVLHVCVAIIAVSTLFLTIDSIFSGADVATNLAVLAIFLSFLLVFEVEWQLLHVIQKLSKQKMISEPVDADNPCNPPENP